VTGLFALFFAAGLLGSAHADPAPVETARQLFMQGSRGLPLDPALTRWCTSRALPRGGGLAAQEVRELIFAAESPEAPVPAFSLIQQGQNASITRLPETVSVDGHGRSDSWLVPLSDGWSFLEGPTCAGEKHAGKSPRPCKGSTYSLAMRVSRDGTVTVQTRTKGLPGDYFVCYTATELEGRLIPQVETQSQVSAWARQAAQRAIYLRAERALFDAAAEAARGPACGQRFSELARRASLKERIRSLQSKAEREALEAEVRVLSRADCKRIHWAEVTDQVHLDAILGRELGTL
jgi:hypothetical protein